MAFDSNDIDQQIGILTYTHVLDTDFGLEKKTYECGEREREREREKGF